MRNRSADIRLRAVSLRKNLTFFTQLHQGRLTLRERAPSGHLRAWRLDRRTGHDTVTAVAGMLTPAAQSVYRTTHPSCSEHCRKIRASVCREASELRHHSSQAAVKIAIGNYLLTVGAEGEEARQWMQVHTRLAVASHLSVVCLSLSLTQRLLHWTTTWNFPHTCCTHYPFDIRGHTVETFISGILISK